MVAGANIWLQDIWILFQSSFLRFCRNYIYFLVPGLSKPLLLAIFLASSLIFFLLSPAGDCSARAQK